MSHWPAQNEFNIIPEQEDFASIDCKIHHVNTQSLHGTSTMGTVKPYSASFPLGCTLRTRKHFGQCLAAIHLR